MKFFLRDAKGMRARMKTSDLRDTVHDTDISMGLTCRINGLSPFTKTDMGRLRYVAQLRCQTDAELVRTWFGFLSWYDEGDNKNRTDCHRSSCQRHPVPKSQLVPTIGRRALPASNRNLSGLIGVRARAFSANIHRILYGLYDNATVPAHGAPLIQSVQFNASTVTAAVLLTLTPTPPSSS
jgi:hypothetical protein